LGQVTLQRIHLRLGGLGSRGRPAALFRDLQHRPTAQVAGISHACRGVPKGPLLGPFLRRGSTLFSLIRGSQIGDILRETEAGLLCSRLQFRAVM